jgi:type VI secretion system protein VasG
MKTFKPAFLGRVSVVPYLPLSDATLRRIVELQLGRIRRRVEEAYRAKFDYSPELVQSVAARCTEVDTGARNIDHILSRSMLPEISAEILSRMADGRPIQSVFVSVSEQGKFQYQIA